MINRDYLLLLLLSLLKIAFTISSIPLNFMSVFLQLYQSIYSALIFCSLGIVARTQLNCIKNK